MKVKNCEDCIHCKRKVWSSYHKPTSYHAIGMSHAYAYCEKHKEKVRLIKKCQDKEVRNNDNL